MLFPRPCFGVKGVRWIKRITIAWNLRAHAHDLGIVHRRMRDPWTRRLYRKGEPEVSRNSFLSYRPSVRPNKSKWTKPFVKFLRNAKFLPERITSINDHFSAPFVAFPLRSLHFRCPVLRAACQLHVDGNFKAEKAPRPHAHHACVDLLNAGLERIVQSGKTVRAWRKGKPSRNTVLYARKGMRKR